MPATFPSHQGLIAWLWRRWPGRFDVTALCVGAAMPDIVDAAIGLGRGHFGQGLGHSLLGLTVFGLPGGMLLTSALRRLATRAQARPQASRTSLARYAWDTATRALAAPTATPATRPWTAGPTAGVLIGGLSHLLFDLVSHGGFPWLMPWMPKIAIYPHWWYDTWLRIPLPWKPTGRKVGPHATLWLVLSIVGAWNLLYPTYRAWRCTEPKSPEEPHP